MKRFEMLNRKNIVLLLFLGLIFAMLGLLTIKGYLSGFQNFKIAYAQNVSPEMSVIEKASKIKELAEIEIYNLTGGKTAYNEVYGGMQRALGKKVTMDAGYGELYKTYYKQITFAVAYKPEQVKKSLEATVELKKSLDKLGIPFLYVQAPFKLTNTEQALPYNKKDYSDVNVDMFLTGLKERNIDYLDLRPLLRDGEKYQNQIFFNTDHHWTIEAAFEATWHIADRLNKDYGFSIDRKYMDLANYYSETTKNCYLGSMGRRTGHFYSGLDDFTLIKPKFTTQYTLTEYDSVDGVKFEGSFEEAILDKDYLQENAGVDLNRYAVYHGDNRELVFENHMEDKGKIMMIKDSFAIPVYSFLSLGVHEIRALDMRLFKESVSNYAGINKPEVVILLYNGDTFSDEMFEFGD